MIESRKLVLVTLALASSGLLVAACSGGGGGSSTPTGQVVLRGDGGPADFSCNHSYADPASVGSSIGMNLHTVSQGFSTTDLPGMRLAEVTSISNLTTTGNFAISDAMSLATLNVTDSTRVHLLATHDPTGSDSFVPTYGFDFLSPAVGSTSGSLDVRIIPQTIYNAFIGFTSINPSTLAGTVQVAGAVGDCADQGAQIQHATVQVTGASLCGTGSTIPCIVYIKGGAPDVGATETDENGAFIVLGLPANTPTTVKVYGILTQGGTSEEIGELNANGEGDTIALSTSTPLRN